MGAKTIAGINPDVTDRLAIHSVRSSRHTSSKPTFVRYRIDLPGSRSAFACSEVDDQDAMRSGTTM